MHSHATIQAAIPVNSQAISETKSQVLELGPDGGPLLQIDGLCGDIGWLQQAATEAVFQADPKNFYPGVRSQAPARYTAMLQALAPTLTPVFFPEHGNDPVKGQWHVQQAAFAITTQAPATLRPIQMLPHFDTTCGYTLALVHYLAGEEQGGTSFYQHRATGFQTITEARLPAYASLLKQQAQAAQLHLKPQYQQGDSDLFRRVHQVVAKPDRALVYHASTLHSGDLLKPERLSADPRQGRLTVSCLLRFVPA